MKPRRQRRKPRRGPTRIPFLNLPGLVQENILKRLKAFDVVSLSLCSTRTTKAIHSATFPTLKEPKGLLTGGGVHVEIAKDYVSVVLEDKIQKHAMRVEVSEDVEHSENLICSSKFKVAQCYKNTTLTLGEVLWLAYFPQSQMNEAAKRAIEHICFLFRLPVIRVSVNVNAIPNFHSLFIWDFLRGSCPDVHLHISKSSDEAVWKVPDADISKFFRKFKVGKRLALELGDARNVNYQFSKLRNLDFLLIKNARWMKDSHFEQLHCEYLEVYETQITEKAINTWLKKWMNSTDTKTKVLSVTGRYYSHWEFLRDLTYATHSENTGRRNGQFGSFKRRFWRSTNIYVSQPNETVYTLTRADGAVAKMREGLELSVYMTYNN